MDAGSGLAEREFVTPHLLSRREKIAEAALEVLSAKGLGGLTHRAVDRHLAIAEGSTSFYFRRRDDLLSAAARKSVELNLAMLDELFLPLLAACTASLSVEAVAERLLTFWKRMMNPSMRYRVVARTELYLEALRSPFLREIQAHELKLLDAFWGDIFMRLNAVAPTRSAQAFGSLLRGAMYVHSVTPYTVEGLELTASSFEEQLKMLIVMDGRPAEGRDRDHPPREAVR